MITKEIDYSEFEALFAEQILREMGGERARAAIEGLLKQQATKAQIMARFKRRFPSWTGTAERLDVVIDYLQPPGEG